jgi:hypothetical protein
MSRRIIHYVTRNCVKQMLKKICTQRRHCSEFCKLGPYFVNNTCASITLLAARSLEWLKYWVIILRIKFST